jgi:5'-phosphate synthase pdxT subunit
MAKVGVLALQGAFREHREVLEVLGASVVEVRVPEDLIAVDALVVPGGESTTMMRLLGTSALREPLVTRLRDGMPAFGTCAGLILLAAEVRDGRPDQVPLGVLDVAVRRNGYGRQRDSFETDLAVTGLAGGAFPGVFIRAPVVEEVGESVEVLAEHDGRPVLVRQANIWGATFHPELSGDLRVHQQFVQSICTIIAKGENLS